MNITPFSTGSAELKAAFVAGSPAAGGPLPFLWKVRRDKAFGSPVPILCWLIETGGEKILVDTGDCAPNRQGGPSDSRFTVMPEDEIAAQLSRAGILPQDLDKIVLTHLHQDHVGGLPGFPGVPVLVCQEEWDSVTKFPGNLVRKLTAPVPAGFSPQVFEFQPQPWSVFDRSYPLSKDGRVLAVPTPGHSTGHTSIVIKGGLSGQHRDIFLAGDVTYDLVGLQAQLSQGFIASPKKQRQTLALVRRYVEETGAVYLPSHDRESVGRLNASATAHR